MAVLDGLSLAGDADGDHEEDECEAQNRGGCLH